MMLKRGLIRLRNAAPRNTRLNSSSASSPPVQNAARGTRILVVAALLGGSMVGYMAGAAQTPVASASSSTTPFRYGSQKHFEMAISELKRILGEDKVSTQADDLHIHGYSENDHHEGRSKP
jgi:D-lactate dehydrogenase (cytochrome)